MGSLAGSRASSISGKRATTPLLLVPQLGISGLQRRGYQCGNGASLCCNVDDAGDTTSSILV